MVGGEMLECYIELLKAPCCKLGVNEAANRRKRFSQI